MECDNTPTERASITSSAISGPAVSGKSTAAPAETGIAELSQTANSLDRSVSHYDFFVAYATPDRQQAQDLCWYLQDNSCKVFLDVEDLRLGASWPLALQAALEASRTIVVLVSTHADDAFYQQEEIVRAIQLARDKPNAHTVIPVILENLPQGAVSMPYGMSSLQAQDATRPGGLKRVANELVAWLNDRQRNTKQPQMAEAMIEATEGYLKIEVTGKDSTLWRQFRPKLIQSINNLLDTDIDTEHGTTVRDETPQLTKALIDYAKANLARPGLENDKIGAEVRRLYIQIESDRAEARKINAEAEAIEVNTKIRRLWLILVGAKAMMIGEEGEEALMFARQIDEFLQMIKELASG